ncbi:hypothetical protein B0H13DRAFT_2051757 [Mycena leptocephala]|nr:hypothetical protein B0H13DRAFT_2051757 [Mycena leptocephala]
MDTVSSVLDMLFKSYLTQPWRTGQRIVSNELGKAFPPTLQRWQKSTKSDSGPNPDGVRPTPPGWFSDMHVDFAGLAQAIVHCDGEKLWLFWPATAKNLDWWGCNTLSRGSALDAMEGLEVMHVTDACAFIVPPSAFTPSSRSQARRTHASLSLMRRIGPWRGEVSSSAKRSFVTPCTRR